MTGFGPRYPEYPPSTLLERGLDLLFPPLCVGCRRIGRWICERCWTRVAWSGDVVHFHGGAPRHVDRIITVADFSDVAREAVHALKYHHRHAISGLMGHLMAQAASHESVACVVPVPLHASRRRERGYDQAALLARVVARSLDRPYRSDTLRRARPTAQQATLDAAARQRNVAGAFNALKPLAGTILCVDDVVTTGATMGDAARALREAGADVVVGLVFARAL